MRGVKGELIEVQKEVRAAAAAGRLQRSEKCGPCPRDATKSFGSLSCSISANHVVCAFTVTFTIYYTTIGRTWQRSSFFRSTVSSPLSAPAPPGSLAAVCCSPSRSPHFVSRAEAIKGVSNRFIFSRFYIYLYLAMAALSSVAVSLPRRSIVQLTVYTSCRLVTVVLSLLSDCPTFTFYMLEIIVNTAMIVEVSIRLVAFGKVSS